MNIGPKIRNLRLAAQLTMDELAQRSGLTKGFISQIERDLTSITLDNLEPLLGVMDTTVGEFFNETLREKVVHPAESRTAIVKEGVKSFQLLVAGATNRDMEPALLTLKPGQKTDESGPYPGEEFGFMIKGRITLQYGPQAFKLKKGDSFYFSADRHHRLHNSGPSEAIILWVTCPPYF